MGKTRTNRASASGGTTAMDSGASEDVLSQLESNDSKLLLTSLTNSLKGFCMDLIEAKDREIQVLNGKIMKLEEKVDTLSTKLGTLEGSLEDSLQAQHKDIYILTGPELPAAIPQENCFETVTATFRNVLRVNCHSEDFLDATRIGRVDPGKADRRPICIKLKNRDTKRTLVDALKIIKPKLYLNDYLTSNRRSLLERAKKIKNDHPHLIKFAFVRNGNIFIKRTPEGEKIPIKSNYDLDQYIEMISSNDDSIDLHSA